MDRHPSNHNRPSRSAPRRWTFVIALAVAATGVGGVLVGTGSSSSSPHAAAMSPVAATARSTVPTSPPGGAEDTSTEASRLVFEGQPQSDPEPEPPATPGVLQVSTNAIHLPDGVYSGSFEVSNTGGSPVEWIWAAGDVGITVSSPGGTLAPGEHVVVSFTIDHLQLPEGDFLFANCIYNDDVAKDVTITGHRISILNPDLPKLDLDFKAKK